MADEIAWAVGALRDREANDRYALYRDYYDGVQDLAFATPKFESAFGRLFEAFAYNRCAAVVDAHADRLHVDGFVAGDAAHGEAAKAIWDRNRMDKRQGEVYQESMAAGVAYVLVWPDAETDKATIWPQEAANVRVRYDPERPGNVLAAAKTWTLADGRVRLNVYEPDRVRRLVTKTKAPSGVPITPKLFAGYDEDGGEDDFTNRYGVVPIVPFPNNAPTGGGGRSELRDVAPVQDALNKTLTDKMVAMELAAYPQRVILGLESVPTVMDYANDPPVPVVDPATGLPPDPLRPKLQRFEVGIDRILTLTGQNTKIAEFQAVALAQFVAVAEFWDVAVSRVSKVPVHYLHLSGGFPSGRALRTAEAPFVAKLVDKQNALGNGWEDAVSLALRIDGVAEPAGGYGLSTMWRSAAPMGDEDQLDLALQRMQIGVPLEQNLRMLGWDEDVIRKTMDLIEGEAAKEAERQERAEAAALARLPAGGERGGDDGEDVA